MKTLAAISELSLACGNGGPSPSFWSTGSLSTCEEPQFSPWGILFLVSLTILLALIAITIIRKHQKKKFSKIILLLAIISAASLTFSLFWAQNMT
jgi:uncharacterized membrane protein YhaH (DUF805 family)